MANELRLHEDDERYQEQNRQTKRPKSRSKSSGSAERCHDGFRFIAANSSHALAVLPSSHEDNYSKVYVNITDRDFQFFRHYERRHMKLPDSRTVSCFPGIRTIAELLLKGCRSRSAGRLRDSRFGIDSNDDDDGNAEFIELSQIDSDCIRMRGRRSRMKDAGHMLIPIRITALLWCDKCGQPIISVYKRCFVCRRKYSRLIFFFNFVTLFLCATA